MKHKFLLFVIFFLGLVILVPVCAQAEEPIATTTPVNLYFFYANTCPHCHDEANYLAKLQTEFGNKLNIRSYELTEKPANVALIEKFGQKFNIDLSQIPTPVTFIGKKSLIGYGSDEIEGANIKNLIEQCLKFGCPDVGQEVLSAKDISDNKDNTLPVIIIIVVIVFIAGVILINRKKAI